ncbi:hypothetical protein MHBO_004057, partial [Bonamia ostreae]
MSFRSQKNLRTFNNDSTDFNISEMSSNAVNKTLEVKKLFETLRNQRILEKCLNRELGKGLFLAKRQTSKVITSKLKNKLKNETRTLILQIADRVQNDAEKAKLKKRILKLQNEVDNRKKSSDRQKSIFREKLRCSNFSAENINKNLRQSEKTVERLRKDAEEKIKKEKENAFLNAKIENLVAEMDKGKKMNDLLTEQKLKFENELSEKERQISSKNKRLASLFNSLEESRTSAARKINDRFLREQERIEEMNSIHRSEINELEAVISRRDEEIKELLS